MKKTIIISTLFILSFVNSFGQQHLFVDFTVHFIPIQPSVDTLYRTLGKDSIQYTVGHRYHAIRDSTSSSSGWLTTGNTGTDTATNFIGTNDNNSFNLRVGGRPAGHISYDPTYNGSVALGLDAMPDQQVVASVAIGGDALKNITRFTGVQDVAIGRQSLTALALGNFNTAVGDASASLLTSGNSNTAVGTYSLNYSTSGDNNTAVGQASAAGIITGSSNTFVGAFSGADLSAGTGSNNVALGYTAFIPSGTASNQLSIQNIIYGINNAGTGTTISTGFIGVGVKAPTSKLHVNGSLAVAYVAKTASYTLGANDYTVEFTANVDTATLPTAVGIAGRIYVIVNSGTSVLIKTTSSQTLANVVATPTTLLLSAVGSATVQSNGANWLKLD